MRRVVNHFKLRCRHAARIGAAALLLAGSHAEGREIVINAVGDIMLAGSAARTVAARGYGYPFSAVADELKNGDVAVANLEAPITAGGTEFVEKKFRFRTGRGTAEALRDAGISVVTLANNHIMDFGAEGVRETLRALDEGGILHAGAGENLAEARRAAVVAVDGKKVAFLSYSLTFPEEFYAGEARPGTAPGYRPYYRQDIARARQEADYVVVSFHWGAEGAAEPKPYQTAVARAAVDAGADAVIGHHPHVLQGVEIYRGRPILYSLGNFIFGSMSRSSDRSVIARITLSGENPRVELIPVNVLNREVKFRPVPLSGKRGAEVIARLKELSLPFATTILAEEGRYYAAGPETEARYAPLRGD